MLESGDNFRPIRVGLGLYAAAVVAQEVPGFSVGGPAAGGVGSIKHDCLPFAEYDLRRDDVPNVFGDYVNGDEIKISGLVGRAGAGTADAASVATFGAEGGGRFDLHADELTPGFDYDVIAGGVSPGLDELEAMAGGSGHELELGPLAAAFAIRNIVFLA